MKLTPTPIPGVLRVEAEPKADQRGYFARTFDDVAFADAGIHFVVRQCGTSFNEKRGTLRGLHYQTAPAAETKLVRCTRGVVFDVALDLRRNSQTYRRWFGVELTAERPDALLIPCGCAHGFVTLTDASEVLYQIDQPFRPDLALGVRWNDPAFAIKWPIEPMVITARDSSYRDFTDRPD